MTPGVAIVGGTGALGFGLAVRLGAAGVSIAIGSRDEGRAIASAEEAFAIVPDGSFSGHTNAGAVALADVIVLAVPFASQARTLADIRDSLHPDQVVVDTTVPLAVAVGGRATRLLSVWEGSAAEQAQALVPDGVPVVAALHTISAAHLRDLRHEFAEDVLVCGPASSKPVVFDLLQRIAGLRVVDAGPLQNARLCEALTPLLIGMNGRYRAHAGIRITGLAAESPV